MAATATPGNDDRATATSTPSPTPTPTSSSNSRGGPLGWLTDNPVTDFLREALGSLGLLD